ncbi:hypothetical protein [Runella slithyformis]|nr:hypothetical protein [Runella slithyformis]
MDCYHKTTGFRLFYTSNPDEPTEAGSEANKKGDAFASPTRKK